MRLNDITSHAAQTNGDAANALYELWLGERPIEIKDNQGEDWKEKPVLLSVDGLNIPLTANQADAIRAQIAAALVDYTERITPTFQGPGIGPEDGFQIAGAGE